VEYPAGIPPHGFLFGEDQGRYLLATAEADLVKGNAEKAGIPVLAVGRTGGDQLTLKGAGAISIAELQRLNEAWLPSYMEG
jgi:phosphoribosylformylglycinamidine synthase subunit PurL